MKIFLCLKSKIFLFAVFFLSSIITTFTTSSMSTTFTKCYSSDLEKERIRIGQYLQTTKELFSTNFAVD